MNESVEELLERIHVLQNEIEDEYRKSIDAFESKRAHG